MPDSPIGAVGGVSNPPGVDFDLVGYLMRWEAGLLGRPETIRLFQWLVDSGDAWHLSARYRLAARNLIADGSVAALPPKAED